MKENAELNLPASGLAEDILSRFMDQAQQDVNLKQGGAENAAEKSFYHLVTFHLDKEEYGVEIGSVQEIIRATDITPVPGAQTHVPGVINLRGKIIPVIDLRNRFRLPQARPVTHSGSWLSSLEKNGSACWSTASPRS